MVRWPPVWPKERKYGKTLIVRCMGGDFGRRPVLFGSLEKGQKKIQKSARAVVG
jgi:hypothetical protein